MKFSVYDNMRDASTDFVFRLQHQELSKNQMMIIQEKMTDRIAHVLAREYLKKKGLALRRMVNMAFIERQIKNAVINATFKESKK